MPVALFGLPPALSICPRPKLSRCFFLRLSALLRRSASCFWLSLPETRPTGSGHSPPPCRRAASMTHSTDCGRWSGARRWGLAHSSSTAWRLLAPRSDPDSSASGWNWPAPSFWKGLDSLKRDTQELTRTGIELSFWGEAPISVRPWISAAAQASWHDCRYRTWSSLDGQGWDANLRGAWVIPPTVRTDLTGNYARHLSQFRRECYRDRRFGTGVTVALPLGFTASCSAEMRGANCERGWLPIGC